MKMKKYNCFCECRGEKSMDGVCRSYSFSEEYGICFYKDMANRDWEVYKEIEKKVKIKDLIGLSKKDFEKELLKRLTGKGITLSGMLVRCLKQGKVNLESKTG